MNNIDKEIEDFKNNLLTIDKLSKDLNNNNDKLEKVLKETTELDNVKKSLQSEVDNLKKSNEGYIEKVEKSSNEISQTCEQINKSVESIPDFNISSTYSGLNNSEVTTLNLRLSSSL